MAKTIDIRVLGDRELQRKLNRVVDKVQKKIVRHALREGGRPVLANAQAKVPTGEGRLKASLKLRARRARRGEFGVEVRTGTRQELGIPASATGYYPASIEYGWTHARSGLPIPARSYMRAAADEQRVRALGIIGREIGRGIEMEARRG